MLCDSSYILIIIIFSFITIRTVYKKTKEKTDSMYKMLNSNNKASKYLRIWDLSPAGSNDKS